MEHSELQQLLKACRKNDRKSQRTLYGLLFNYAMTICSRYAGSEPEAQEMMNDGFVKVFLNMHKYRPEVPFRAWLNRIMVNTAIDYYRKRKDNPPIVDLVYARHAESKSMALDELSTKEILQLVQKLPPAYRLVFSLYVVEGYKHEEIAEQLQISVGTSKSNLARAKAKLRKMILNNQGKQRHYG